jgi:hypothetical protein
MKKIIAGLLFLVVVFFNVVILKPTADGSTDSQLTVPDITFIYDGQTIYDNFFLKLTPEIIPTYKKNMLWDYPYPIIYTAFLFLMGQILFEKGRYRKIFFIAVFTAFIFDYAENLTQLYLINELPTIHLSIGTLMGVFTKIKWITVLFALISVLIGLLRAGIAKFSTAKQ